VKPTRRPSQYLLPVLLGALFALGQAPAWAQNSLDFYAQPTLKDLTASIKVINRNDAELKKIGKGYVDVYKLSSQQLMAREPGQVRFQAKRGILGVRRITSGGQQLFEVPGLGHRKVDDVTKKPGKADSITDLGVITPSWLRKVNSQWLRTENRGGKTLHVFETSYKDDTAYRRTLVMDPATRTMVEVISEHRERSQPGFKKRFVFSAPKQISGVWIPTRCDLYSPDNRLAASMQYDDIKVNTGLQDSLFRF
jgi:hypothetical protein